jgi:hypothetical protein
MLFCVTLWGVVMRFSECEHWHVGRSECEHWHVGRSECEHWHVGRSECEHWHVGRSVHSSHIVVIIVFVIIIGPEF